MASFIGGIVNIAIGAIVLQSVFLQTIHSANDCVAGTLGATCNGTVEYGTYGQAAWSSSEISLWSVLGLAGIIGLLVGVLQLFGIM
jgi:hypothetical protein